MCVCVSEMDRTPSKCSRIQERQFDEINDSISSLSSSVIFTPIRKRRKRSCDDEDETFLNERNESDSFFTPAKSQPTSNSKRWTSRSRKRDQLKYRYRSNGNRNVKVRRRCRHSSSLLKVLFSICIEIYFKLLLSYARVVF